MEYEVFKNDKNMITDINVRLMNDEVDQLEIFRDNFYCPFADASEISDDIVVISHNDKEFLSEEELSGIEVMLDNICNEVDLALDCYTDSIYSLDEEDFE